MLTFVPIRFDLYRPLKAHLRWTLQCLVGFADRSGRCFPSVRKLAEVTGISKSSVSRHLAALERQGIIRRHRKPGGVYAYTIDGRFLPAQRGVSHQRDQGVPHTRREEHPAKNKPDLALPDDRPQWRARLRSWQQSGFWLPQWGPRPNEPGCFASGALAQRPA